MSKKKNQVVITGGNSTKLVKETPIRLEQIEIPIIPPREHVEKEITIKTVRIKRPVQIKEMNITMADGGGYKVQMPGGEVHYFGAHQEVLVGSMTELLQLIANCLGQTTYEYVEVDEREYNDRWAEDQKDYVESDEG